MGRSPTPLGAVAGPAYPVLDSDIRHIEEARPDNPLLAGVQTLSQNNQN